VRRFDMTREMHRDAFGVLRHNQDAGILELEWTEGSSGMTDDDFMAWLTRYVDAQESVRAPNLVIDVRRFAFSPGAHVGGWRDQAIIPRYNAAGVRKFAFLLPAGSQGTVAERNEPAPEPPGTFPTGYFDSRAAVDAWFAR
jgi:hypothetical protein